MVQFLSIIFFLGFLQFLLGFSKVPVFLCHPGPRGGLEELTGRTEFVCCRTLIIRTCIWTRVGHVPVHIDMCFRWYHLSVIGRDEWQILDKGLAVAFRKAGAKSLCWRPRIPPSVRKGRRHLHKMGFGAIKDCMLIAADCTVPTFLDFGCHRTEVTDVMHEDVRDNISSIIVFIVYYYNFACCFVRM